MQADSSLVAQSTTSAFWLILAVCWSILLTALTIPLCASLVYYVIPDCGWPFSRIFDRVILGWLLLCLFFLRGHIFRQPQQMADAFKLTPGMLALFLKGTLIALSLAVLVVPLIVEQGQVQWVTQLPEGFFMKTLRTVPVGILVGLLEEWIFRALFFAQMSRLLGVYLAAGLSSLIYAAVHFISPIKGFEYGEFDSMAGINYLGTLVAAFSPGDVGYAFFGMWLVGIVLCGVYRLRGSLALCAGMHCGWIIIQKLSLYLTKMVPGTSVATGFERRYFMLEQPLCWVAIMAAGLVVLLIIRPTTTREPPG